MAADLSHLLSVDKIKHKHEKTCKSGKWTIMWMFRNGNSNLKKEEFKLHNKFVGAVLEAV